MKSPHKALVLVFFAIAAQWSFQAGARAQAWVGAVGELESGFGYTFSTSDRIIETNGDELPNVPVTHQSLTLDVEYVPLERLAVNVSAPVLALKYDVNSASEYWRHGSYDDGDYHFTLQDLALGARYALLESPLAAAVSAGVSLPLTKYEVIGAAGAGRGLKQAQFGLALGRGLGPFLPRAFVMASYQYTLSERLKTEFAETAEYNQDRSNIALAAGYQVLSRLQVFTAMNWQIPHGGLNFIDIPKGSEVLLHFHDLLLREEYLLIGGGASYSLTDKLSLSAQLRAFITGKNTRDAHLLGLALSYAVNINDLIAGNSN